VIYYTTDGSTPTIASAVYSAALSVNATTIVKAIAVAGGYTNSAVTSATYTISATGSPVSTPVSLAATGNVYAIGTNATAVTNGGIDTWGYAYSSNLLGSTVSWSGVTFDLGAAGTASAVSNTTISLPAVSSTTLNLLAVAVNGGHRSSFVVTYTDGTATTFSQSLSSWLSSQGNAGESVAVTMAYRINQYGAIDNRPVYLYGYSFALDGAKTVKSLTLPATRNIVVMAATLSTTPVSTPAAATPSLSPGSGTYTAAQSVTLADATPGAVIYYTTNGATPTTASALYSTPLTVNATTTVKAIAAAGGYSNSAVASATYTISAVPPTTAATPTLSPAAGTYASAQTVTISDTTAGAVIYYTTNGSTPTTASTQYAAAIAVSATATVKAIAVASGYSNSAVASAAYTISTALPAAAAPTLSVATGTYAAAQSVVLADATPGAVIYYTTNGSTPTTASAIYSTALTVNTTTTVKAVAVASGYSNSAVSSATYTITTSVSAGTSPVSLAAAFNVYAIGTNGVSVTNGGLDTWGFAYSSSLLGPTVTWSGVTFNLGTAETADAVSNATITLPAVKSSKLNLLGAGVNGSHANQTFVLTYTDGTTTTLTQSVSDWYAAQNYTGESIAVTMAYRINQYGVVDNHAADLYGYSFAIDSTKTVKSLRLPSSRNVVVLAAAL
jgi:Chitobiase/beta-hexosaminidase C-terminal domain/Fn3 associated